MDSVDRIQRRVQDRIELWKKGVNVSNSESEDIVLSDETAVSELRIHVVDGRMFITYREDSDKVQPTRVEIANALAQMSERMLEVAEKANGEDRHWGGAQ